MRADRGGPAMTWDEIAEALGSTKQAVWQLYNSALKKLRMRPTMMARICALAEERQRIVAGRQVNFD
jgi:DNA-directed RNA polymerase sigma subunit (sigma70/sigma32)